MLNEKVDVLSLTPEERKLYESRMKLKSDIATISEVQFKAGIENAVNHSASPKVKHAVAQRVPTKQSLKRQKQCLLWAIRLWIFVKFPVLPQTRSKQFVICNV